MPRRTLSRTFKDDINTDYGIYPDNGEEVVMEAVDQNTEYEQQVDVDSIAVSVFVLILVDFDKYFDKN